MKARFNYSPLKEHRVKGKEEWDDQFRPRKIIVSLRTTPCLDKAFAQLDEP